MVTYQLSPYVTFVASHLTSPSQYAVFHRLTGELVEINSGLRSFLLQVKEAGGFSFEPPLATQFGTAGRQVQRLIDKELLIGIGVDPLPSFLDFLVIKPLQNPAVTFRSETRQLVMTGMSMAERVYSRPANQRPEIIEEVLPEPAAQLWLAADGTRTLRQMHAEQAANDQAFESDNEFRSAIDLLTEPARQLIKLAPPGVDLDNPFLPFNTVPRDFYHAAKRASSENSTTNNDEIKDFHREGIKDASWEFDLVEPTVNHALRFPSAVLGGLDYGARFFRATQAAGFTEPVDAQNLSVLEIGGGTGSFARSFINEAKSAVDLKYHILDLSPALIAAQDGNLSRAGISIEHFEQDATQFDLPGRTFDLVIANEVIADFPVTLVESDRTAAADLLKKYQLSMENAPARFYLNSGVFQFLERAWLHLKPGGAVVLSEYGAGSVYPIEAFHLNHSEFSIHFGHVSECAQKIGFETQLQKLSAFLSIDDNLSVLNGREEHLMCLEHVFRKFGVDLPFALFSEADFEKTYAEAARRLDIRPIRFGPLKRNFHYGPGLDQFWILLLKKPKTSFF